MKVALCFSGIPRFVSQTCEYWHKCLIKPYQPHVFVHGWVHDHPPHVLQIINACYQPQAVWLQPMPQFDVASYTHRIWPHRITPQAQFSQFTGIHRCQMLRQRWQQQHDIHYDVVIRARWDWFLESVDLQVNNCVNVARTPTLDGHKFFYDQTPLVGISDQFAYGSSHVMNVYGDLVNNMHDLYHNHGVDFCGELFLRAHLHEHHIPICEHVWNQGIVRSWGIMP